MSSAIVLVSNPYLPDPRVEKEVLSLVKSGIDVRVLARNTQPELKAHEKKDGYTIDRISLEIPEKLNFFTMSQYMMKYYLASLKFIRKKEADIIHCHDLYTLPIGIVSKIISKNKLIYDCHEHYQELIIEETGTPKYFRRAVKWLVQASEHMMAMAADAIITVDDRLSRKFQSQGKKTIIVANYPKNAFPNGVPELTTHIPVMVYGGGINRQRGIMVMVNVLRSVKMKKPDARLIVFGEFKDDSKIEVEAFLEKNQLRDNVIFKGWVAPEEALIQYSKANVCLALLQPIKRFKDAVPIKLFEYMLCSRPVIISEFPDNRKIVQEAKCGFLVNPTDIEMIAEKIMWLFDNPEKAREMGENGRKAALKYYSWEREEKKLLKTYKKILKNI